MRQHLIKAHGWSGRPLHFILSLFATQNLKTPVYECKTCLSRFTHRQRHIDKNTGCKVQRITRDNTDCYPQEVIVYMKDKRVLSERGYDVMCQFQEYCTEKLKKPLQNFQFDFISRVFRDSQSFKRIDQISESLNGLKKEKQYTFTSVRKLCFDLKTFIRWLKSGRQKSYRFNKPSLEDAITSWLKENSKEGQKEQKERNEKRFSTIPTMEILCETQDLVEDLIEKRFDLDSQWHTLSVQEKLSLLLFQIHSRANCRLGVLLNFTVTDLENYQPGDYIRSREHKTGSIFMNYAYITDTEKRLLQSLHRDYEEQFKVKPSLVFPGHMDKALTTQSTTIARLMNTLFNITEYKFHPNACRKVWDTYYFKNKKNIPEHLRRLFESNTGHSDKTRELHYTLPPSNEDLSNLFAVTGQIRQDCRQRRSQPCTSSVSNQAEVSVENPSISLSESSPQASARDQPSTSRSTPKRPINSESESESKIEAKKLKSDVSNSLSVEDETDEDNGTASDFTFKPPTPCTIEKIPKSSRILRSENNEVWDLVQKKMLKQGYHNFYLKPQFRRACQRVAAARQKLSKSDIRNLVRELDMPATDEEIVFKKLYTKVMNVYASLRI